MERQPPACAVGDLSELDSQDLTPSNGAAHRNSMVQWIRTAHKLSAHPFFNLARRSFPHLSDDTSLAHRGQSIPRRQVSRHILAPRTSHRTFRGHDSVELCATHELSVH
jgi:hypothetical protein